MAKTITVPEKTLPVYDEADVLVVGSGPAGHSAAIAASRAGAKKVILVERFNHLGGMVTGGFVILIPHLSTKDKQVITGLQQEWLDRMAKHENGYIAPEKKDFGSTDPALLKHWSAYFGFTQGGFINNSAYLDPDMLKVVLDEMIEEEGGKIVPYMQCWGVAAIMDGKEIKGVVIESKEGRKAIMAKVVIDATGDGDIGALAGCSFDDATDPKLRISNLACCYRLGGVDFRKFADWKSENLELWNKKYRGEMREVVGFGISLNATNRNDQCWVNTTQIRSCINVKDLTDNDRSVRLTLNKFITYARQFPGMENAYLLDMAPQTGTRGSRRICGEYTLDEKDIKSELQHEDTVLVVAPFIYDVCAHPIEVPYRVMLPIDAENLLITGRAFSSSAVANDAANLVPHCAMLGQAAGVAAAIALEDGVSIKKIDIAKLKAKLKEQNVYLPR